MISVKKSSFGETTNGDPATLFTLQNGHGMTVALTDYGGTLVSVEVPDRAGKPVDVVLGYDSVANYEKGGAYFGAIIGRCANRIGGAQAEIAGETYKLAQNDAANHLHGGNVGFDKHMWQATVLEDGVRFSRISKDGEENYPGNLSIEVMYQLLEENALAISYHATTDAPTICNLTNHAYFNLAGHESGDVSNQWLEIAASAFTPTDSGSIPTGELRNVEGTVFDFRKPKRISEGIDDACEQIQWAGGFDHNWVSDFASEKPTHFIARAWSEESGIELTCMSSQPGVQFYSGNSIDSAGPAGKNGAKYGRRGAFCLETQAFPDAVHHADFPSVLLAPQESYEQTTVYAFGVRG